MSNSKEYIECRIFILGDEKVGKKSFVKKFLNLPCTTIIRNKEAEEEYNKLYSEMKEKIEKEKNRIEEENALLQSVNDDKKPKKEYEASSKFASSNSLFKIEEERTLSKKQKLNISTKRDVTNNTITGQITNNNSSSIILDSYSSFKGKKI